MKASEVLACSLAMFDDPKRWGRGHLHNLRKDSYCAIGAVNHCAGVMQQYPRLSFLPPEAPVEARSVHALYAALPKRSQHGDESIIENVVFYNDRDNRRIATIRNWFRRAIVIAEAAGD